MVHELGTPAARRLSAGGGLGAGGANAGGTPATQDWMASVFGGEAGANVRAAEETEEGTTPGGGTEEVARGVSWQEGVVGGEQPPQTHPMVTPVQVRTLQYGNLGTPPAQGQGYGLVNTHGTANGAGGGTPQGLGGQGGLGTPPNNTNGGNTVVSALKKCMEKWAGQQERLKKEFTWQKDMGGTAADSIKETILAPSPDMKVYGLVLPGSTTIRVVHSLAKYIGEDPQSELNGQYIGFFGDRAQHGGPTPVILPPQTTWKWDRPKISTDKVGWATAVQQQANKFDLWVPPATGRVEWVIPRLISLPARVGVYCMEGARTAYEVFQYVQQMCQEEDSIITAEEAEFLLMWLMAAGQKDTAAAKQSAIAVDTRPVMSNEAYFLEWQEAIITGKLGRGDNGQAGPATQVGTNPAPGTPDPTMHQLVTLLTNQQAEARAEAKAEKEKARKKEPYTPFEMAKIMGYSHVLTWQDASPIWNEFSTTKSIDEQRKMLMDRMDIWATTMRTGEIGRGVCFSDAMMKAIVEVKFWQGSGPIGILSLAEKGATNIACLPMTDAKIAEMKQDEKNQADTMHTRTMQEMDKLAKKVYRNPPKDWYELQCNTGTFASLLWALFTDACPLYEQTYGLFSVMKDRYTHGIKDKVTGPVARGGAWAIFDATAEYFSQTMTPAQLRPGLAVRRWPMACLDIAAERIKYAMFVYRPTYPAEWKALDYKDFANGVERPEGYPAGSTTGGGGGFTGIGGGGGQQQGSRQGGRNNGSQGGGNGGQGNQSRHGPYNPTNQPNNSTDHVHPEIAKQLKSLWEKHGSTVEVASLLRAAGKEWPQAPHLTSFMKPDGTNTLCYNYVCGICRHGNRCNFAHVPGAEVHDGFAKELMELLETGVKWQMTQPPYQRPSGGGGYQGGGRGYNGRNGGGRGGGGNYSSPHKRRKGN